MNITYIVPMLAPYAIPRYQALAKLSDTDVHVIVEANVNKERSGWAFKNIKGVHMHLVGKKIEKKYVQTNKEYKYHTNHTRLLSYGLKKMLKEIKPDIVLVCNSTQIMMLPGKRNYKLGIVVEDTLRAQESRNKLKRFVKNAMLKRVDFYLPYTNDARDYLESNNITGPFISSSWSMDNSFFTDLADKEKIKFKLTHGLNAEVNYILVANLIPCKGIIQFLDGWFSMDSEFHGKSKLSILGDGELYDQINQFIKGHKPDNVILLGSKSYMDVSHFLQCGDVFVLPTLEDLCSLAVLEAMASGLPILTTVYNGARDFVSEGENGFIFNPLNRDSIVTALQKISSSDLQTMSMKSKRIISNYSNERVMEKLRKDLEMVMDE